MRKMKDSGIDWIGEIPEDWQLIRANNIFQLRGSKGNSNPILLAASQTKGMFPQNKLEGVVKVAKNTDFQKFNTVKMNDFVISLRSFQGGFEMSEYEGVCSPAYQVFCNKQPIYHLYWKYLFKSQPFISKINSITQGIREGKNIQFANFKNIMLPFVNIEGQKKIADFLDEKCSKIDAAIAKQEQLIKKLKEYKQSLITEVVTRGLDPNAKMKPSGIDWIGDIPNDWNLCKAGLLLKFFSGEAMDSDLLSEDAKFPVFGGGGIKGYYKNFNLAGDSIIISRQGATCGTVRYNKEPIWATEHALICYPIVNFNARWLSYWFTALNLRRFSMTSAQPGISATMIESKEICCLDLSMQLEIADYLDFKCDLIETKVFELNQVIEKLQEYKKSLIYEYVTGKKEVV